MLKASVSFCESLPSPSSVLPALAQLLKRKPIVFLDFTSGKHFVCSCRLQMRPSCASVSLDFLVLKHELQELGQLDHERFLVI